MMDAHEVAELVSAFEDLQERATHLDVEGASSSIQQAISELDRHGVAALPIMKAAYHRFESRIASAESFAKVHANLFGSS